MTVGPGGELLALPGWQVEAPAPKSEGAEVKSLSQRGTISKRRVSKVLADAALARS